MWPRFITRAQHVGAAPYGHRNMSRPDAIAIRSGTVGWKSIEMISFCSVIKCMQHGSIAGSRPSPSPPTPPRPPPTATFPLSPASPPPAPMGRKPPGMLRSRRAWCAATSARERRRRSHRRTWKPRHPLASTHGSVGWNATVHGVRGCPNSVRTTVLECVSMILTVCPPPCVEANTDPSHA